MKLLSMVASKFKMVLNSRKVLSLIPLPSLLGFSSFGANAKERFLNVTKSRVVSRDAKCGGFPKGSRGRDISAFY